MRNRRRLRRIVVKKFQLRFVAANLLFFCLLGTGFVALLFGPLIVALLDTSATFEQQSGVASAFLTLHTRFWLSIALVAVAGVARLAIVSHRVAGPLVQFTRAFEAMRGGDVSMRVKVRGTDYLQTEAAALDSAVRGLRRRLHAAKSRAERLEAAVDKLRIAMPAGSERNMVAALQSVEKQARLLRRRLDAFRTVPAREGTAVPERRPNPVGTASSARTTRRAGFTLIEVMLVVVILTTMSALAIPAYSHALDRAKVVRAVAEIRAISMDIMRWNIVNGRLPDTLLEAGIVGLADPYNRPYQYLRIDNLKGKGPVRKDKKLNPINSDFDLYSMGKDGVTKLQVSNKDSLDDIIRASDGGFVGLASDF